MQTKTDWQYHIEEQKSSGFNKAEYCRQTWVHTNALFFNAQIYIAVYFSPRLGRKCDLQTAFSLDLSMISCTVFRSIDL